MSDNNNLGDFLRLQRLNSNKSQKDMACDAHLSQSVFSRIENGNIKAPTVRTLNKLAHAFGVPYATLISLTRRETKHSQLANAYPFIEALACSNCTEFSFEDLEFLIGVQRKLPEIMTIPLIEELMKARKKREEPPSH